VVSALDAVYGAPMGATGRLTDTALRVECGQEATTTLTVRNTGTVVDEFAITVLGESAAWAVAEPGALSLFPDAEGTVTVRFRPPRNANTPQGVLPFGVGVGSREDPSGSVVEEGQIDLVPFIDLSAEIVPRTSRGRLRAFHEVAIDNRGNDAAELSIAASDPDGALSYWFPADTLTAAPGTASFTRFRVSAGGPLWRGTAQTLPFSVTVTAAGQPPIRLDASFQHQPLIPAWLPRAIAVCFALVLASVAAWYGVIKDQVRAQAVNAANTAPAVQQANTNVEKVARETGVTLNSSSSSPSPTASSSASTAPAAASGLGNPVTVPVQLEVSPTESPVTMQLNFPAGGTPTFSVASLLLQNPYNDAGIVTVSVHKAAQTRDEADVVIQQSLLNQTLPNISLTPPMQLAPTDNLRVQVRCSTPGAIPQPDGAESTPQDTCQITVLVGGYVRGAGTVPTPTSVP
jgi:hypothetical protein